MHLQNVDLRIADSIAHIDMRYPPSNILDFPLMAELSSALEEASSCAFLILSSSMKHFSMGVDIKIHTPEKVPQMLELFHGVIRKLYRFPGISACFLHGYALGGGLELALPCDVIFAQEEAKLGFPEIRLACFPPVASVLLPRMIGRHANSMVLFGDTISAREAQRIALVDALYEKEDEFRTEFTQKLLSSSHDAMKLTKKVLRQIAGFDFEQELRKAESVYVNELLKSPDVAEGIEAFLQKRPPKYRRS